MAEKTVETNGIGIKTNAEIFPLDDIKPYPGNPKKHPDKQIEKIKMSIIENDFSNAIIIDKNNIIIAGHGRYYAALELGMEVVPCIKRDDLSERQVKLFRIADNKVAESPMDDGLLINEFDELLELENFEREELELSGFDLDEIDELYSSMETIDDVKEDGFDLNKNLNKKETVIKKGDLVELGKHRLLCGDSTDKQSVEKLMDGQKCDLIVTDPPYNVDYVGKTEEALTIENDSMSDDEFYQFLYDAFSLMHEFSKDGAAIYVFHADTEGHIFRNSLIDSGYKLASCCIWAKNSMVMGRQDYHWQHEPILYGWKPSGSHNWYADRKQTTLWEFDRPLQNKEHPTMKPVKLVAYPIQNSSKEKDLIVDLFAGSGSTLIACEETGRVSNLMELDGAYSDVIVRRYINYKKENNEKVKIKINGDKVNNDIFKQNGN